MANVDEYRLARDCSWCARDGTWCVMCKGRGYTLHRLDELAPSLLRALDQEISRLLSIHALDPIAAAQEEVA